MGVRQHIRPATPMKPLYAMAVALILACSATGYLCSPSEAKAASCKPVPVPSSRTVPPYPEDLLQGHESGTVHLQITLARNGHPRSVKVVRTSGFRHLDEFAANYVQLHYLWQPISCATATATLNFRLDPGGACAFTKSCGWQHAPLPQPH